MCFHAAGVNSGHPVLRLEQPERIKSFATRTCHRGMFEDAGSRQNTTIAWMPDICGVGSIGMTRPSVPTRRQRGLLGAALAVWTAPTTLLGHAFARLSGCPEANRIDASPLLSAMSSSWNQHFSSGTATGCWLTSSLTRGSTIGWAQPICLSTQCCRPLVSCSIPFARLPSSHLGMPTIHWNGY
jgi:hypothetical protein